MQSMSNRTVPCKEVSRSRPTLHFACNLLLDQSSLLLAFMTNVPTPCPPGWVVPKQSHAPEGGMHKLHPCQIMRACLRCLHWKQWTIRTAPSTSAVSVDKAGGGINLQRCEVSTMAACTDGCCICYADVKSPNSGGGGIAGSHWREQGWEAPLRAGRCQLHSLALLPLMRLAPTWPYPAEELHL